MDQAWIDAARRYSSMSVTARADYWSHLTTAQQALLAEALSSSPKPLTVDQPRSGRTVLATLSIGCVGMILGSILTIAIEVIAIGQGIAAIRGLFDGSIAPSRPASATTQTLRDEDLSNIDCATLLKTDPDRYSDCVSRQKTEEEMIKRNERTMRGEDSD